MADLEIESLTAPIIQSLVYVPPSIEIIAHAPPDVEALAVSSPAVQVGIPTTIDETALSPEIITVAFAFGDASPKLITTAAAGKTVFTATIVIQVGFNGSGAALVLGDAEQPDRLLTAEQNDPTLPAEYEVNPAYTYSAATPIFLSITPGEGCTQGSGYILLEV